MFKSQLTALLILILTASSTGQVPGHPGKVIWGSERYVEYIVGNAPLILAMPHGGSWCATRTRTPLESW